MGGPNKRFLEADLNEERNIELVSGARVSRSDQCRGVRLTRRDTNVEISSRYITRMEDGQKHTVIFKSNSNQALRWAKWASSRWSRTHLLVVFPDLLSAGIEMSYDEDFLHPVYANPIESGGVFMNRKVVSLTRKPKRHGSVSECSLFISCEWIGLFMVSCVSIFLSRISLIQLGFAERSGTGKG
jgi:hypothetical protein